MEYTENKWFLKQPQNSDEIRMFCFPYAGAGGSIFKNWSFSTHKNVGVYPIQYPGRENRLFEPPINNMDVLISEICKQIKNYLDRPYILFGHSLGAKVAFHVAVEMQKSYCCAPGYLVVAGAQAPHIPETNPIYNLNDDYIINELRRLGGTPDKILDNKDIMKIFLPTIRADYTLSDNFIYEEKYILECPILAIAGKDDSEASENEVYEWKNYTKTSYTYKAISGGHFFISTHESELLELIAANVLYEICLDNLKGRKFL